jgi:hypothetical protein
MMPKNIKIETYKTIILSDVLHGFETWSLTLREDCDMKVFENRMLRKIFTLMRDDIKGG